MTIYSIKTSYNRTIWVVATSFEKALKKFYADKDHGPDDSKERVDSINIAGTVDIP